MEEKNLTENENNGTADSKKFFADMFDWMCSIFSAILCFIIIFALFARVITVDGESMVPTLQDQQRLIVSDMFYTPQYDDIVILYADKLVNESSGGYGKPIVKRVIGLPGDKIRIDFVKGVVYRNGEQLPVYGNADAVLAVTHTKLSAESNFVFQVIVVYEVLKLFNDFTRTLKVAGAADANYYFHIITIPFP